MYRRIIIIVVEFKFLHLNAKNNLNFIKVLVVCVFFLVFSVQM